MNLKFEINKTLLEYKKPKNNIHTDESDDLFCSFVFTTPDWKHLEKYAIFWDRNGKSFIQYLGKGMKTQCPIPKEILSQLFFHVQVYANDKVKTKKIKVFVYDEIPKKHHHNECCKKNVNEFIDQMNGEIDNIIYDNNKLLIYSKNELVKTIDIIDEGLIAKIITESAPKFIIDKVLSENSENPVANKTIFNALQSKVNISSLSTVAFTGDYNDLKNTPVALPTAHHTHESMDINDWDEAIDEDLESLIINLTNSL